MKKFIINKIGFESVMRFGCGLGAFANLIPGLVLALIGKATVSALRALLESWQNAELANIFGQSIRANMLAVLKLEGALKTLQTLDNAAPLVMLVTIVAWMLFGGIVVAALSGTSAALYNVIARTCGGIEIELREK